MGTIKLVFSVFCIISLFISCDNSEKSESAELPSAEFICTDGHTEKLKITKPGKCAKCSKHLVKNIEKENQSSNPLLTKNSALQFGDVWVNQNRSKIALSSFAGNLTLTTMVFTRCEYACPNIIGDIQSIENQLSKNIRDSLNIVLVTFDPENDTPEVLHSYSTNPNFGLDQNRWVFLHGERDYIYQYSRFLGIGYKKFENGMYGHSNIISLLNKNGEIIYQLEGIHADSKELVKLIQEFSN